MLFTQKLKGVGLVGAGNRHNDFVDGLPGVGHVGRARHCSCQAVPLLSPVAIVASALRPVAGSTSEVSDSDDLVLAVGDFSIDDGIRIGANEDTTDTANQGPPVG